MDSLVSSIQNAGQAKSTQSATKLSPHLCEYLKDHIMEELEGAKDYMSKAIELKERYPAWGQKFYKMAEMEVEHANCMNKIFISMDETDYPCHDSMYKEILESYTKYMTEISAMKQMYHS